jgi:glutamate-1-semialdehyde 2,1-aminomutase
VLTPEAYTHLDHLGEQMMRGALRACNEHGIEAYGHRFGAKGCLVFHPTPVRHYREFLAVDTELSHCHWLFQHNGGVFLPPWGKSEQWTLSVQHTDRDARRFVANVERFAEAASTLDERQSHRTHHSYA